MTAEKDLDRPRGKMPMWRPLVALALASVPIGASAATCSITVNPLNFGAYNGVTKAQVTSITTLTLTCTGPGTINYTVTLSPGQSASASARYMLSGRNRLNYQIYRDSGRTQIFGDNTGSTTDYSGTANLSSTASSSSAILYGAVLANQLAVPGSYADSLTVQVTY